MNPDYKLIQTRQELIEFKEKLRVRDDWHEPDEQGVSAETYGKSFDNAGFWGFENLTSTLHPDSVEQFIAVYQDGVLKGQVNLALLFAWATGLEDA